MMDQVLAIDQIRGSRASLAAMRRAPLNELYFREVACGKPRAALLQQALAPTAQLPIRGPRLPAGQVRATGSARRQRLPA
jgi:hypothetical protein